MSKDKLELAIELACIFHAGQFDKQGKPYIIHPMYVMSRMDNEETKIVAVLHDIFENTSAKISDISETFGDDICQALLAITRGKDEKYFDYINRCCSNEIASIVKYEDLKHNISKCGNLDEFKSLKRRYNKALNIIEESILSSNNYYV